MRVFSYTNAHLVSRSPSGDLMLSSMLARKRTETLAARSPKQSTSSSSQPWGGGTGENLQQRFKDTFGNQAEIHLKNEANTFRKLDSQAKGWWGAQVKFCEQRSKTSKLSQRSKDLKLRMNRINSSLAKLPVLRCWTKFPTPVFNNHQLIWKIFFVSNNDINS